MSEFIHENFLLENKTAEKLYFDYASGMPIIDYHCHLSPHDISIDRRFENLTKIWLDGDHYKLRLMRANGVHEEYCTGEKDDLSKFIKWAETLPFALRNPIYHWTQMELKKPFGITELLNGSNAASIYEHCNELLAKKEYSFCSLLERWNVEVLCTTDDPADNLEYHKKIKSSDSKTKVLPAWRPDKAMTVENPANFNNYMASLEKATNKSINNFNDLIEVLENRHEHFHQMGCRLSDHGLETFYASEYTENDLKKIFTKIRSGKNLKSEEREKFRSGMLIIFAEMDFSKGWVQQFHIGPIRNTNSRMKKRLGSDSGYDSIGDQEIARPMAKFFNRLEKNRKLCKTVIYNINPKDNEVMATMAGNFQDGSYPGKMQWGSAWWFLDQKDGIEKQLNALSNLGLLGRFVGMLTDSRSVLSYSRHEYFRRILCNIIGNDVEKGLLPDDIDLLGDMIKNISYFNAKNYFDFE